MTEDFANKRIVVTGAASGIGAALASILTTRGADIIGLDIADGEHVRLKVDLSDPSSIDAAIVQIDGPLSGLANIAGLPGTQSVEKILSVNLLGLRQFTEGLAHKITRGGSIVCVSSVTADRCVWSDDELSQLIDMGWSDAIAHVTTRATGGKDAYELSKKALNILMLRMCAELSPCGIRINCASPGPVETPILADFEASIGADRIAAAGALTGRHAQPEDIADAIAFLLSNAARWVNGTVLKVDGGLHGLRLGKTIMEAA